MDNPRHAEPANRNSDLAPGLYFVAVSSLIKVGDVFTGLCVDAVSVRVALLIF